MVHIQSSEALKLKVCTQSSNALKMSKSLYSFILYACHLEKSIVITNFMYIHMNLQQFMSSFDGLQADCIRIAGLAAGLSARQDHVVALLKA